MITIGYRVENLVSLTFLTHIASDTYPLCLPLTCSRILDVTLHSQIHSAFHRSILSVFKEAVRQVYEFHFYLGFGFSLKSSEYCLLKPMIRETAGNGDD
jgi:hypothetical protein